MILPAEYAARMKRLLGADYDRYVEALARPPVRGITVNTDKISADEFARNFGFPIKPSGFSDDCFILTDDVKTGRSPFHHGGAAYVQEPGYASCHFFDVSVRRDMHYQRIVARSSLGEIYFAHRVGIECVGAQPVNRFRRKRHELSCADKFSAFYITFF